MHGTECTIACKPTGHGMINAMILGFTSDFYLFVFTLTRTGSCGQWSSLQIVSKFAVYLCTCPCIISKGIDFTLLVSRSFVYNALVRLLPLYRTGERLSLLFVATLSTSVMMRHIQYGTTHIACQALFCTVLHCVVFFSWPSIY